MDYDPKARRDTALARKLVARIRRDGPIPVDDYVRACLYDPEHGYYRRRASLGAAGDFVTAPEISQVFGELVGLWCAVVWQQMGSPPHLQLIELGPGRGTMMRDALRASRIVPGFLAAVGVKLVETSPVLRTAQAAALRDAPIAIDWCDEHGAADLADASTTALPTIVLANELLDVLAPEQHVRRGDGWALRQVGVVGHGQLAFTEAAPAPTRDWLADRSALADIAAHARDGDILERWRDWGILPTLATRRSPFAALVVDYGHTAPALGDTLQAIRRQRPEHPLTSPGEADLTHQVDFSQLCTRLGGLEPIALHGPVTQAELLGRLGIVERASRLMAANPTKAGGIEAGVARLIAPQAMGTRFKAIGIRSIELPPLPGFG